MFTESPQFQAAVRTQQIITGAILSGLMTLFVVALIVDMPPPPAQRVPVLSYVSAGLALMNSLLAYVVPGQVVQGGLKRIATSGGHVRAPNQGGEEAALLGLGQTGHITRLALLEGAGFLGCIAYMIEREALGLIVAGVMACFLLACFPTPGRVRAWLERHKQRLVELKNQ